MNFSLVDSAECSNEERPCLNMIKNYFRMPHQLYIYDVVYCKYSIHYYIFYFFDITEFFKFYLKCGSVNLLDFTHFNFTRFNLERRESALNFIHTIYRECCFVSAHQRRSLIQILYPDFN